METASPPAKRVVLYVDKYCWRCNCDLTRRKAERLIERCMKGFGFQVYYCRRCCTHRYRR